MTQYMYEYGLIAGCGARRAVRFGWEGTGWLAYTLPPQIKYRPPSKFHTNSPTCVQETAIIFQELPIYFDVVMKREFTFRRRTVVGIEIVQKKSHDICVSRSVASFNISFSASWQNHKLFGDTAPKHLSGLVQEPSSKMAKARASLAKRKLGLQQGWFRASVQRADAAVPRGLAGGLRLPLL